MQPTSDAPPALGLFLEANQMLVDPLPDGLRATTSSGASLSGRFRSGGEAWQMSVPNQIATAERWSEVEDLVTVVLTTGWRRAGWVPFHGAALIRGDHGVLVCAGGMGGKTTFALALLRRGWRCLGDDKLLLRDDDGRPIVAAIKHVLNVDPDVAMWFPELRGLVDLPRYSAWTAKRRLPLSTHWPDAPALEMIPTHVLMLNRLSTDSLGPGRVRIHPLSRGETIAALLRQSVIPRDPRVARPIAATLARLGEQVRGFRVDVENNAYADPAALEAVEQAIS